MANTEARQQVLLINTERAEIRNRAIGWSAEDGWQASEYARTDRAVGLMGYFRGWYAYPTVYHAIGDGWRLLAPPVQEEDGTWTWWLVRDVTRENATHPIGGDK